MQILSANQNNTQPHNIISHGNVTPQTISHFTAPPIGLRQLLIKQEMVEIITIQL
jgi:hypothetical protein